MEADEIRRRMPAIIEGEANAINRTFQGRSLDAGTRAAWTVVAGRSYIAYGLRLGGAVLPQDVEKLLSKLTEALSALRRRPTDVRLRRKPLALEVAHPFPAPLDWHKAQTALGADTMLTGRNYSGGEPCDDVLAFDDTAHVLAVGMTGSGKSTLLRMMIASLALNTEPANLRLFIVDPKAEDFLPFERLPHCEMFAGRQDVTRAIARVRAILADRQDTQGRFDGPRVVLFLDELSQVREPVAIRQLNDLMAVGRSKRINVILATQYPTKDVIGKVDLSNVGVRFVGQVATNKEAYIASGRGETGAHLLPGKGAFLRVEGADAARLQAYWLDDDGTEAMVDAAVQRWGKAGYKPVTKAVLPEVEPAVTKLVHTGYNRQTGAFLPVSVRKTTAQPVTSSAVTVTFPLPTNRPPTPAEALALRQLYEQTGSKNEVIRRAYGSKNGAILGYVNQALSQGGA
jgi:S-DNA-T family DNA segregation ATPase FtsK/SpoIIIE